MKIMLIAVLAIAIICVGISFTFDSSPDKIPVLTTPFNSSHQDNLTQSNEGVVQFSFPQDTNFNSISNHNYNTATRTMTASDGNTYRPMDCGVISINNSRTLAFAITGTIAGENFTCTSTDYDWTWHSEKNGEDYIFWAENNDSQFVWKQYYHFYANPQHDRYTQSITSKAMKVEHYLENNLADISNAQMFYFITVSDEDIIRWNKTTYAVDDMMSLHVKKDITNETAHINFNAEYDFNFEDLISNGFMINEFYIGDGAIVNRPTIDIVAIGFTKNNGAIPKGSHIWIDPTFSTNDIRSIDACPLDSNTIVVAWADQTQLDRTFAIYDTDGTLKVGPIDVDTDAGLSDYSSISVSAFNSTTFVVAWFDHAEQDASFRIYNNSGTALTGIIDADTAVTGLSWAVSVSAVNETAFAMGWFDRSGGSNSDIYACVYDSNGNTLSSIANVDDDTGYNSMSVSVSAFNSTTFVVAWFDDEEDDISFRIYDTDGTALTGILDADNDAGGNCRGASVSAFNSTTFVIGWYDDVEKDASFRIYDDSGTALTGIIDADTAIGGSHGRVAVSAVNETSFVIMWYDTVDLDITYRVYYSSGVAITNAIDVDTSPSAGTDKLPIVVTSMAAATGISICDDNFVLGWVHSTTNVTWGGFQSDGTPWDGVCFSNPSVPPTPINLQHTTSTGHVNYTWSSGTGNVTDTYNVLHNGIWTNGSANTYMNNNVGEGNWSNITVYAWNSSGAGTLSAGNVSDQNTAPYAFNIDSYAPATPLEKIEEETQFFNITALLNCQCRWYINGTLKQTNTTQQMNHNYTNTSLKLGYFNFSAVVNTSSGTTDMQTWWVTVDSAATYKPPEPTNLANTTGNFWVNHTWQAGSGNTTDGYNVSVNGAWYNMSYAWYNGTYSAHDWQNISVWAWNNSGVGTMSD